MRNLRIAVTGASGNLGLSVLRELARRRDVLSVVGIARRVPSLQLPKVQWHAADVAESDLVTAFAGADAVIHLAWAIQPSRDQQALWRTNVVGSERVFDAAVASGVGTLVHASSVGAYRPGPKDRHVDETWPTDGIPGLGYSWQKAYVERVLDGIALRHPELRVARIRPALILQRLASHRIDELFLRHIVPGRLVPPHLTAAALLRSPVPFQVVHADDAARAFASAAIGGERGPFNIAAAPVVGRAQPRIGPAVVTAGRTAAAGLWTCGLLRTEPGWIDLIGGVPLMDTSRAEALLKWSPSHDATSTLSEFFGALREKTAGPTPALSEDVSSTTG